MNFIPIKSKTSLSWRSAPRQTAETLGKFGADLSKIFVENPQYRKNWTTADGVFNRSYVGTNENCVNKAEPQYK